MSGANLSDVHVLNIEKQLIGQLGFLGGQLLLPLPLATPEATPGDDLILEHGDLRRRQADNFCYAQCWSNPLAAKVPIWVFQECETDSSFACTGKE